MGEVHTRMYRDGTLVEQGFPLADVSKRLELSDTTVWIDLCGPSEEQLHVLAPRLGLHELAVEDVFSRQRPKLDRYDRHLFLSCHAARVDVDACRLDEAEVDVFVSHRWLITVRTDPAFRIEPVLERWDRSPDLAVNGVGFLLYGLLDVVVDSYFDVTQTLDEFYERISEGMFAEQRLGPLKQRQWFDMTRAMFRFHRLVVPMREVCGSLVRREHSSVPEGLSPYFQDVYDHVVGVIDDWNPVPKFYDVSNGPFNDTEEVFFPFSVAIANEISSFGNTNCWKDEEIATYQQFLESECVWWQYWVELPTADKQQAFRDLLTSYIGEQKKLGRYPRPLYFELSTISDLMREFAITPPQVKAMSTVSLLFLIVCSLNLVGLLLGKFLSRIPEISVRRALGASRAQVFWQHIVECEVVGVIGGAIGMLLAAGVLELIGKALPNGEAIGLTFEMVLASIFLSLIAGLMAGLYPAWRVCTIPPAMQLKLQ